MQPFNVKVHYYAEKLIETPRAHLRLTLWQHENGLELFHEDNSNNFILFRSLPSIRFFPTTSYDVPESQVLLDRLLSEAEAQRGGSSDAT